MNHVVDEGRRRREATNINIDNDNKGLTDYCMYLTYL